MLERVVAVVELVGTKTTKIPLDWDADTKLLTSVDANDA
jgi:hypothetical protein